MTQKKALKLRAAIDCILSFCEDGRYKVAVCKRYPDDSINDWEVHLYVHDSGRLGYIPLAVLAQAIESVSTDLLSSESTYDACTVKGENVVHSVRIW